jgi:hypothetical protein
MDEAKRDHVKAFLAAADLARRMELREKLGRLLGRSRELTVDAPSTRIELVDAEGPPNLTSPAHDELETYAGDLNGRERPLTPGRVSNTLKAGASLGGLNRPPSAEEPSDVEAASLRRNLEVVLDEIRAGNPEVAQKDGFLGNLELFSYRQRGRHPKASPNQ